LERSGKAADSLETPAASLFERARGGVEGALICRGERVEWGSPELGKMLGFESPEDLEGRTAESLFEGVPRWREGSPARGRLGSGDEVWSGVYPDAKSERKSG
jgi:hypothetical protein